LKALSISILKKNCSEKVKVSYTACLMQKLSNLAMVWLKHLSICWLHTNT